MTRRFTVAGKRQHVGQLLLANHLLQLLLQFPCHLLALGHRQGRAMVLIKTTLTVDAVEAAYLAVGWQQIDAQRYAQSATMYRSENRRRINNCTHSECKVTN